MNDEIRRMARRVATLAAEGNEVGARIQLQAMRKAQGRTHALSPDYRAQQMRAFIDGEFEQVS